MLHADCLPRASKPLNVACGPTERIVSEVTETDENGHSKTTVTREPIEPNCVDDIETRAHAVASLYAPDGVLLATVSPLVGLKERRGQWLS